MRLPLLISLSLLLCAGQRIYAQLAPADDFFHRGAQFYLSNNVAQARAAVDMGLKQYPEDEKLKKLDELLKQQSQQQQQQQQQQDQQKNQEQKPQDSKDQQQQNQSSQKPDDQKDQKPQEQKSPEQQKQDEQKQADQKKADEKKDEPPKTEADQKDGEKPEDKKGEGQPLAPNQMTPEEAKRLLDAQKGNEQTLQLKPDGKPRDPRKPVKDW